MEGLQFLHASIATFTLHTETTCTSNWHHGFLKFIYLEVLFWAILWIHW